MKDWHLAPMVVIKILRYQVAAFVAASIIGGGPWAFNADTATVNVETGQITLSERTLRVTPSHESAAALRFVNF